MSYGKLFFVTFNLIITTFNFYLQNQFITMYLFPWKYSLQYFIVCNITNINNTWTNWINPQNIWCSIRKSKNLGLELLKCKMVLDGDYGFNVNLTVWGDQATKARDLYSNNPLVDFWRDRFSDFGRRSIKTSHQGAVMVQPRVPNDYRLKSWWSTSGEAAEMTNKRSVSSPRRGAGRLSAFAEHKTISSIQGENMGKSQSKKPNWISFKGTFKFIKKYW